MCVSHIGVVGQKFSGMLRVATDILEEQNTSTSVSGIPTGRT
jgi:hypothetical protein